MHPEYMDATSSTTWNAETPDTGSALLALDDQLGRLEKTLASAEDRLAPILSNYATAEKLAMPRDEPSSQLKGRAVRLLDLNSRFEELLRRVDL